MKQKCTYIIFSERERERSSKLYNFIKTNSISKFNLKHTIKCYVIKGYDSISSVQNVSYVYQNGNYKFQDAYIIDTYLV